MKTLGPQNVLQSAQRLVGRPSRPEAVGAGQKVLFVDVFQHHGHSGLRHLVFEGWNAEHPLRAVRLRDVCSADRRRVIAARLDALQEVQKIGLQVHFVVRRCDAVDAGSTILAGQPIGLLHPVQIDDVVERVQRRPSFRPCQIGYPLSVRGQVRGVQSPLPCFRSTALIPWRRPSLARVPVSPVPRGQRYYEGATTSRPRIPGRLFVSLPGSARSSVLRARLGGAPGWLEDPSGPGHLVSRPPSCRRTFTRSQAGSHRFPGDPSHAFAPVQDPGRTDDPSP